MDRTTTTTTFIKKYFIVGAVVLGSIAALSQIFVSAYPEEITKTKSLHTNAKKLRYQNRIDAFALLEKINKNIDLPEDVLKESKELILDHSKNERDVIVYTKKLKEVKAAHKVNGFANWNAFLGGIGSPTLLFVVAIIFLILYLYRNSIDLKEISKSYIFISTACLFTSLVYLIWGFSPKKEISYIFYMVGIVFTSIFSTLFLIRFLKFLFSNQREVKLQKALNAFARFAFRGARKHIKEGEKAKIEYEKDLVKTLKDGM